MRTKLSCVAFLLAAMAWRKCDSLAAPGPPALPPDITTCQKPGYEPRLFASRANRVCVNGRLPGTISVWFAVQFASGTTREDWALPIAHKYVEYGNQVCVDLPIQDRGIKDGEIIEVKVGNPTLQEGLDRLETFYFEANVTPDLPAFVIEIDACCRDDGQPLLLPYDLYRLLHPQCIVEFLAGVERHAEF